MGGGRIWLEKPFGPCLFLDNYFILLQSFYLLIYDLPHTSSVLCSHSLPLSVHFSPCCLPSEGLYFYVPFLFLFCDLLSWLRELRNVWDGILWCVGNWSNFFYNIDYCFKAKFSLQDNDFIDRKHGRLYKNHMECWDDLRKV